MDNIWNSVKEERLKQPEGGLNLNDVWASMSEQ